MKTGRHCFLSALGLVSALAWTPASAQARPSVADRLHAQAVDMFRSGRVSEAYGRFISLAEAGHPASAKYAMWMCEHGPELFGKDWDCSQQQIDDWASAAGVVAPIIGPRLYGTPSTPRPTARPLTAR